MNKMKLLSNICLLFITIIAFAPFANATPISQQKTQQYYQSCLSKPDPQLTSATQDQFCKCTAQFMQKNMTYEDLVSLAKNERPALNKMMIGVYAPCIKYPVHDHIFAECKNHKATDSVCQCLSTGIGEYTQVQSVRLLKSVLDKYPNAFDPVAAIKQTPEFQAEEKRIATHCVQTVK